MLSKIGSRITYTNLAMTLALVFAMTGGAYAASKYLITSTKQISPKVLKALSGKVGRAGATGPTGPGGPGGPAGATGVTGPQGAKGDAGAPGNEGPPGIEGLPGKDGSPWAVGGTLPAGKSETGQWVVSEYMPATETYEFLEASLSFPVPLKEVLDGAHVHYIGLGEGEGEGKEAPAVHEGECKGTVAKPEAAKGNLCVFTAQSVNFGGGSPVVEAQPFSIENAENGASGAGPAGALLSNGGSKPAKAGFVLSNGAWVVTA